MLNTVNSQLSTAKLGANKASASFMTSPIKGTAVKSQISANPALAHMNYFIGGQFAFKGHACATSNFRVLKLEDVPCGCCGMPMVTTKQRGELCRDVETKGGKDLVEFLTENKKYFRNNESAIVNYIIDEAKADEMTSIDTIMSRSSNVNTHEIFNNEQKRVLNNIKSTLLTNHCKNQNLNSYIDENIQILNSEKNTTFNRNSFLSNLNQTLKDNNNLELRNQVLDKAIKLPVSEKQIERFFEKYSQEKSGKKIMERLLNPATGTAEHIRPHSLKGPNNTGNYMGECGECNSKRGNYDLNTYWMTNYPNMPESAQKNVDFVTEKIVNGELGEDYTDYPVDLKKALEKETQGQIKLNVLNPEEIDKMRKARQQA